MMLPVWLFDLDNTLHDANPHIFPHINQSMTLYLQRHLALDKPTADALRQHYWMQYGATLQGLVRHHGTDPRHFLNETHRFDRLHEMMVFDRAVGAMLSRLRGRKIVFSNAPQRYANAVLEVMGVRRFFSDVIGIEQLDFHPKPGMRAYRMVLHRLRLNAHRCVLIEDTAVNLLTAKKLGMKTVLVGRHARCPAYVDLKIPHILKLHRATRHWICDN